MSQVVTELERLDVSEAGFGPEPIEGRSPWRLAWDRLRRDRVATFSAAVIVMIALAAILAPLIVRLTAGYFGGAADTFLSRVMDVILSFPLVLFAIALVSIVGRGLGVTIGVIAFFNWASVGRIVRGQTLSLKEKEYVEAARSLGA